MKGKSQRLFWVINAFLCLLMGAFLSAGSVPSEWQSWGAETDWELTAIAQLLLRGEPKAAQFKEVIVLPLKEANAFINPDGYLLVTEGLLERLEGRNEIAFVLAHELSHFIKGHPRNLETDPSRLEHIRTELERGLGTSVVGTGLQLLVGAIASYYSREREREADAEAVRLMAKAGFDLQAARRALQRLGDKGGVLSWFRSHPFLEERIKIVDQAIRKWHSSAAPPPQLTPPPQRAPEVYVDLQMAPWTGPERAQWQAFAEEVKQWFWTALMEVTRQGTCPFYPVKRWQRHRALIWHLQVTPIAWSLSSTAPNWHRWEVRMQWTFGRSKDEPLIITEERFSTTFEAKEPAQSAILSSASLLAHRLARFVVQHCQGMVPPKTH